MTFWSRTAIPRPNRVSNPWRCAHQQPLVAYFPPAKSQQQQRPPSTSHLFGSTRPGRRIQRRQIYELQFHPPGTGKLLAAPSCRRVIKTKSRQNRTFDPGGSQGRLRACPLLGTWRPLLCGEVTRAGAAGDDLQSVWRIDHSRFKNFQEKETNRLRHTYCGQSVFLRYGSLKKVMPSRAARGYKS